MGLFPLDHALCRQHLGLTDRRRRFDIDDDRVVGIELDELVLAYATTIHKSKGSEYPAVVIPLMTQHYPMLQQNLVYTGVTRGKRLVVLIGQRKALAIAVKGSRAGGGGQSCGNGCRAEAAGPEFDWRGVCEPSVPKRRSPVCR